MKAQKFKLILLSFLQFAVWGAYLTSQGRYLAEAGFGSRIGWFYSVQGIVSIFMPAIMGIIADKWIQAQRLLGLCHAVAGAAMIGAGIYGVSAGADVEFGVLFGLYTLSIAFFMPTIAISNSVSYTVLEKSGLDPVKDFPPIRVWGTVGFICSMWFVDLVKVGGAAMQETSMQYVVSGALSIILALYTLTLPECPVNKTTHRKSLVDAMGLRAFTLFRQRKMAVFFIFSMLLGVALQITNGFANPFLADFGNLSEYQGTFGVEHSNMLISLSQISETLCISRIQRVSDIWDRDIGDPLYPADTVLPQTLWYKERDAHSHAGVGGAFRIFRDRQSGQRCMADNPVHVGLWSGFRLFQHIRFALCQPDD